MRPLVGPPQDPPGLPGSDVAQHGALTEGESSGHPPSLLRKDPVTDRVHTLVQQMQAAEAQSVLDGAGAYRSGGELPLGDDAVLTARKLGDDPIDWAVFTLHINVNAAHPRSSLPSGSRFGRAGPGRPWAKRPKG